MQESLFRREPVVAEVMAQPAACGLCAATSPVYDFGLVCCRVRFILSVPVLDIRREWLDRWRKKDRAMSEQIENEVRRCVGKRKAARGVSLNGKKTGSANGGCDA